MGTLKELVKLVAKEAYGNDSEEAIKKAEDMHIVLSRDYEGNRYGGLETIDIAKITGREVCVLYPEHNMSIELDEE